MRLSLAVLLTGLLAQTEPHAIQVTDTSGSIQWISPAAVGPVLYVDASATGSNSGSSWCDAYVDLQDALAAAGASGGTVADIQVAHGAYAPDRGINQTPGDRGATFQLLNGVAMRGGYAGCGATDPDARDLQLHETILTGDLNGDDGPNFANNGENSYHVVTGSGVDASAVLEGFTVLGGKANGSGSQAHGGGLYNSSASPKIDNCTFLANWASNQGGGMQNDGGNPTLTRCTFTQNYAGGAGGGANTQNGDPVFLNCRFTSNNNVPGYGGGLSLYGTGTATLLSCTFTGNLNANSGGAIYCSVGNGPVNLVMVDCTITNNSAMYIGGIMVDHGGHATLTNCLIAGNAATGTGQWGFGGGLGCAGSGVTSVLKNCTIAGNSGTSYGGGISCIAGGSTTLDNCLLWNNTAPNGAQIAIGHRGGAATVSMTYSDSQGGAAAVSQGSGSTLTWGAGNIDADPKFVNPSAGNYQLSSSSPCIDAGNNAVVPAGITTDLDGNPRFVDDPATVDTGNGTVPLVDIGAYEYQPAPPRVAFVDDDAAAGGDGRSWATAYQYPQDALTAAQVDPAVTQIWVAEGTYTPDEGQSQTLGNRAATFQLLSGVALRGGFAGNEDSDTFDLANRDFALHETILTGDLNGDDGPNFANYGENSYHVVTGSATDSTAVLDGFTITGGNANGSSPHNTGGGMYSAAGSPTVTNCVFAANVADRGGGAGNINSANPTFDNCTVRGNKATGQSSGMYADHSSPTLRGCTFADNQGGAYGALHFQWADSPTVINCVFTGNVGAGQDGGGAISCFYSTLTITGCRITGNSGSYAGGVSISHSSHAQITNCVISGNSATGGAPLRGFGGGVTCYLGATLALDNCTITGNSASGYGGGVASFMALGAPGTVTMANCILWQNTASFGSQIAIGSGSAYPGASTISVSHSDVQGGQAAAYVDPAGTFTWGLGNVESDPLFANPTGGDYHLLPGSPCIDAGNNAAVPGGITTDLDGKPRFVDDPSAPDTGSGTPPIVDMGAYEGATIQAQTIRYVKRDATGANTGTSWQDAFTDLQAALAAAVSGDEIWMATGTYKPAGPGGDRNATFQLKSVVGLYGGFVGNETTRDQRDPATHITTLSGDLNGNDGANFANYAENSYHVLTGSGTNATAVLDGFRISGGNANGSGDDSTAWGGGMLTVAGSPTITQCLFTQNRVGVNAQSGFGGAMSNRDGANPAIANCTFAGNYSDYSGGAMSNHNGSSPQLWRCTFSTNTARYHGGALYNRDNASPTGTNCTFIGNSAGWQAPPGTGGSGGAVMNHFGGSPVFVGCLFVGNLADQYGGAVHAWEGTHPFTNCTFNGNSARRYGGAVQCARGSVSLTNCVLWGDSSPTGPEIAVGFDSSHIGAVAVTRSAVQGDAAGAYVASGSTLTWSLGNIEADPLFANPTAADYHLLPGSPCIDAGDNAAVPAGITTDLDGNPRFVDDLSTTDTGQGTPPIVDMGAYEAVSTSFALAEGDVIWTKYIGPRIQIVVSSGTTGVQRAVILDNAPGSPHGIALGPNGHVFFTGNSTLFREVDPVLGQIVGASQTETTYGKGIAVTSDLTVYASDNEPGRLYKVDGRTGAMLASYAMPGAEDIEILPDGDLLVAGHSYNCIYRFKPASGQIDLFIAAGEQTPLVALGLAVRGNGNVLVSSFGQNNVLEYDATGHFIRTFIPGGLGGLQGPWDLDLTPEGDLLVASSDRVLRYSGTSGAFLGQFDSATGRFIEIVRNTGVLFVETVAVGNPGNAGELSGAGAGGWGPDRICGAVDYVYNIGKYEVTAGQYTAFLNAVADEDTYGLYNTNMDYDANPSYGCNIKRTGASPNYSYSVAAEWADRPVNFVSWGDAARFANWLYNGRPEGAQNLTTTEEGSYYLNGATSDAALLAIVREPHATWVIPTEDEWYKAAYHKNDGVTGNYWDYPTSSDSAPSNVLGTPTDPGNNATYNYTIGSPYYRTEVGAHENSESPYGTFDQGGNVWEWDEAVLYGSYRGLRGASFGNISDSLRASYRYDINTPPTYEGGATGFRVADVPENTGPAVQNGSFEVGPNPGGSFITLAVGSTAITGWTVIVGSIDYVGPYWQPSDGARRLDLNGNQAGGVAQTIPTVPGRTYRVSFDLAGDVVCGPTIKRLRVEAAMQTGDFEFDITGHSRPAMGWIEQVWQFTAADTETTLSFYSLVGGNCGPTLDNVRVTLVEQPTLSVAAHHPVGLVAGPINHVDVMFSAEIDPNSFTVDDVEMTSPSGQIVVNPPEDLGNNVWQIGFPEQTADGLYSVRVGPHIADLSDVEMDQDRDGTPGEDPDDAYEGTFTIDMTAPQIIDCAPSGIVNTPVDHVDVTFSEEIKPDTFTTVGILLTGPGGAITVNAPAQQADNTWRISFPTQSSVGDYTIAIGPDITDVAGNPLIQPAACGFSIALPDLVAANLVVPPTGDTGSQITVSWRVANNGTASAATTWQDCVFLSTDNQPGNDTQLACVNRPSPLDPIGSYGQTVGVTIPGVVEGNYWIIVKADSANSVFESNEQNNTAISPIVVHRPNLSVGNVVVPAEACTGEQVAVSWRVANAGAAPAVGNWQDCLYLSVDNQIGGDSQLLCLTRPTNLNAGESYDRTGTITIPAVPAGNYWIVVKADDGNALPETSETDNDAITGPIAIHRPDLVGSNLVVPSSAGTGSQINVSWRVTNGGACPAIGTWRDCVYLSADNQPGNDTQLICLDRPNPLGLGEFYDRTALLTVPGAQDGNYWIILRVDDAGSVPETDENNNILVAGPIGISRPNLVASNAVVPQEAWTGWTVNVAWRVSNIGAAFALGTWRDCVYLSSDNQLGNDTQLLCLDRPTELIRHDTPIDPYYDRSGGVTIPNVPDGDYWIIIKADDANSLAETDENDNVASGPIHIHVTPKPDLKPQDGSLMIPTEDIVAGSPAGIDWVVTNIGQTPTDAPFWYDRVYLSANQTLDGGDRAIGDFQNPTALNPTEAYAQSVQATIPSDLVGNFYMIVKTDAGNNLTEADENNNVLVSSTQLHVVPRTTPTLTITNVQVVPSSTWPEASVDVNWKLTNTGNVGTGPFTVKHNIVLSGDDNLNTTGDNRTLGSQVVEFSGNLAPGASSGTLTTSVAIPIDVWGDRFVFVSPTITQGIGINTWPASAPVQIGVPFPADLEFTFINVEPHGISGQPIIMGWTIRNAANAKTLTPNWVDVVTMSRDQDLGTTADNITLAVIPHSGALDFDQAYGVNLSPTTTKVFLPDDANGRYYVFVTTDALNQVYEGDPGSPGESNNVSSISQIDIEYKAPDLQLISLEVLAGANPVTSVLSATNMTIKFAVKNIVADDGTRVDSWSDQIYLSADDQLDASDISLARVTHSGVLGPNGIYTVTQDVTVPLTFNSATTRVFVCADSENKVHESNEANNCAAYGPFTVLAGAADLEAFIFHVPIEPQPFAHVFTGATITAYWQAINHGPAATSVGSWTDRVYLSTDATLDANDRLLKAVPHSGGLTPNNEYASQADITIPVDANAVGKGRYFFLKVDSQDQNYDLNRNNNIRQLGPFDIWWGPPDLSVQSVSATHGTPRGQVFNVSWTVTNSGGPTVATEWTDKVYLSADRVLSADDVELQGPTGPIAPHTGALAYSESYLRTEPIQVPPNASGYLIVKTDTASPPQVPESNEDNNTNYTALPPLNCDADLVVLSFDAPATALSGQIMKVRWAIRNSAGQATNAGSWRDVVYLSRDQWLDRGADVYLGYRDHNGVLAANDGYETPDVEFRIPYGLTGPYYLFLVTDAGNSVCEIDKTNNVRVHVPVQIELPPPVDLVVTSITPPATGQVGQPAVINWTVKNQGDFEAQGTWTDSVYLSADATWDINDKKVGERRHNGPVGAGAEYNESLTATLPGVVPGQYYVIVRTDIRNEVRESAVGEQNNITVSAGRIDVQLTDLTLGVPHMGTIGRGESQCFRVVVAADETLRISLDKTAPTGVNRVYVRYGQVPDAGRFDYISVNPFDPDHTIIVPTTEAGAYYILVYAAALPTDSAGYVVLAESIPFGVESVTPTRIGDNGQVTITLHGAKFEQGAQVLLKQGSTVLTPIKVMVLDGATVKARFFLASAPHGAYDVEIQNLDSSTAISRGGVAVELARPFDIRLLMLGNLALRAGAVFRADGVVMNTGNVDAPYVSVACAFPGVIRIGWWRSVRSWPRRTDLPEADWDNQSPTSTFDGAETRDGFIVRDLEPSEQEEFLLLARDLPPGPFRAVLVAKAQTTEEYLDFLFEWLEAVRQEIQAGRISDLPEELRSLANDPDEWDSFFAGYLGNAGLLEVSPNEAELLSTESRRVLRSSSSPISPGCKACIANMWIACVPPSYACFIKLPAQALVCYFWACGAPPLPPGTCSALQWLSFAGPAGSAIAAGCGLAGLRSGDPNEKEGPPGYGPQAFVPAKQALPYTVDFENVPSATALARQVTITDQLSPNLDWRTFQLGEVAFGDTVIQVPQRRPFYAGDVALPDGLICRINAGIDIQTGLITWTLTAIDPETGEMPESPAVGLLPPNDPETHSGEGHVTFTIKPKPGLATGTEIRNEATIIFDVNEPIETNEVFNTIDGGTPASNVLPLPAETPTADFVVQWSGHDDANGSGIGSFTIYSSLDGESSQPWLTTPDTTATFTGARGGGTYSFYTVAVDNVGNSEDAPVAPDATTLIGPQIPFAPTPGLTTAATARLSDLGLANVGRIEHAVFEETTGLYVGGDGRLTNVPLWQPPDAWAGFAVRALEHSRQYEFATKARFAPNEETEFGPPISVLTKGAGDADGSGRVTQADVAIVQQALGTRYGDPGFDPRADLNGDNAVTFADLGIVRLMATHSGDFDNNNKIDLADFSDFHDCLSGPEGVMPAPACSSGDSDLDDDVDLRDFAAFQRAFGAN